MTGREWRALALSMPEAEEKAHFGKPDFRVRNKIFAGMSPDGTRGTLKLTPEIQATAMQALPSALRPCEGSWGRSGWTYVTLEEVKRTHVEDLVREAWRIVAPKRLVAAQTAAAREPKVRKTDGR